MKRRTLKQYANLFRNPFALFNGGPDDQGVKVTLWPNGEREIWLSDANGKHSVSLTASNGPAGLGIRIHRHVGAFPLTVRVYDKDYAPQPQPRIDDAIEVCITSYNPDARSQAFKRWYDGDQTADDVALLGPTYDRVSREPMTP